MATWPSSFAAGSSPRVRGTRRSGRYGVGRSRFIPARAGNTVSRPRTHRRTTVHPRACGEHLAHSSKACLFGGSSPRVRGTLSLPGDSKPWRRFIPARAGNTPKWSSDQRHLPVHPRACGEHRPCTARRGGMAGSSPRVRGTHQIALVRGRCGRFIPAHAGNTEKAVQQIFGRAVHPRAFGEHSCSAWKSAHSSGSSPRVRGTPAPNRTRPACWRFIPARAGNTPGPAP